MNPIQFNVKLITPLLMHGSNPRACDPIGLTGKALRGSWRFWFRAMIGGMVPDILKEGLLKHEGEVFGSSDEKIGAKFRMVIENISSNKDKAIYGGFKKKDRNGNVTNEDQTFAGYKEDSEFLIKILPRKNIDRGVLLSTIWLWGNLGGIGQRTRRGFGSPVIKSVNNSDPFKQCRLCITPEFHGSVDIENHLKEGLSRCWEIFKAWLGVTAGDMATNPGPTDRGYWNASFFTLNSLGQVAVGDNSFPLNQAIEKIHGNHHCNLLGSFHPRMASPVFTRLHKVDTGFIPVVTWSKQSGISNNCGQNHTDCIKEYLNNAGVTKWLNR
ncbi:MAG: type III-B CRISPR module RAMP protein Cmr1 [Deltaproteobacteria bacterium]|nr:type III-B CRISPR module RAMP protein Cmr1 [Deltaproteobacteria bacterium]